MAPDSIEGTSFYGLPVHSSQCGNMTDPASPPFLYLLFFDSNTNYCKKARNETLDPNFIGCISDTQISKA
jgi:hypothetical protein